MAHIYSVSADYLPGERVIVHYRHGCGGAINIRNVGETELPVNCGSCDTASHRAPDSKFKRCEVLRPTTNMRCRRSVKVEEGSHLGRWVCRGHRAIDGLIFDD